MKSSLLTILQWVPNAAAHCSGKPGRLIAGLGAAALGVTLAMPVAAQEEGRTTGARAYNQLCAYCHDGGIVGPELKGRNLPPEFFMAVARSGLNAMPAFRHSFIDDESLRAVGEYLSASELESDNADGERTRNGTDGEGSQRALPQSSPAAQSPNAAADKQSN